MGIKLSSYLYLMMQISSYRSLYSLSVSYTHLGVFVAEGMGVIVDVGIGVFVWVGNGVFVAVGIGV